MSTIDKIVVHHSGTLGSDPYVSSRHISVDHINNAHRGRWPDFPSKFIKRTMAEYWYVGYNVVYDPKFRTFVQTRAIGEETAATKGFNLSTFNICIIGNFNRPLYSTQTVDPLLKETVDDVTEFLVDLMDGNKRNLVVAPGTVLKFSTTRINPHRFYQMTDCYGNGITDDRFRMAVIEYETPPDSEASETFEALQSLLNSLLAEVVKVLAKIEDLRRRGNVRAVGLGAVDDRGECRLHEVIDSSRTV